MTEVPKIVYDRLRAARPERALLGQSVPGQTVPEPTHPDADLLTAFAEQALSPTERDGVLEHLARCGDCRELIALALPEADVVAVPTAADTEAVRATTIPVKSQWNWMSLTKLAWPGLRWAALAAGVALAASVLLLHPGKLNQAKLPSAKQEAPAPLPAAGRQIASSPVLSPPMEKSSLAANPASVRTDAARTKPNSAPSRKLKAAPPLGVQSGMLFAYRKGSGLGNKSPAAPPGTSIFGSGDSAARSATETVEVAGATEAVAAAPSPIAPSPTDRLMAQNEAPAIEKAKPALPDKEVNAPQKTQAAVSAASASLQGRNVMSTAKMATSSNQLLPRNVLWAIKAGALQRSLDNGQSWQNALRTDDPLLCYATHAADIWAGGQAGTLFHSVDNGLTWVRVQPSVKDQALSSDVTRIDIRGEVRVPAEIVISTGNNEIWSSADGGQTWDKK